MTRVQHPQPGARAEQRSSPTLQTTIRQQTRWEHEAGLSPASSVYNTIQFEFGIPGEILILNHFNLEAVLLMINIIALTTYLYWGSFKFFICTVSVIAVWYLGQ